MTRLINVELTELRTMPGGEPIQSLARDILGSAEAFEEAVASAGAKWRGLGGLYSAPEQDLVLRAFDAPLAQTREYAVSKGTLSGALDRFGSELMGIDAQRRSLEAEIETVSLRVDDELRDVRRQGIRDALLAAAAEPLRVKAEALLAQFEQAQRECLAALARISRSAPDVVSTFPSTRLDLLSVTRRDMNKAFAKAAAPDAPPEDIRALYAQLSMLGPELLNELGRNPDAQLFLAGMSPHEEVNFWAALNAPQQAALAAAFPALVGNLEGAPYTVRDAANRRVLAVVQRNLGRNLARGRDGQGRGRPAVNGDAADGDTADGGAAARATRADAAGELQRLRQSERGRAVTALLAALDSPGAEARQLISFDPGTNVPLAAVSIGEGLDTAANVSFLVPGMNTSAKSAVPLAGDAQSLGREQRRAGVHGDSTAVVAYMGYEPPTEATVGGMASAERGAPALAGALDGLYLTRSGDGAPPPDVHVVAHSYGTTLAALALEQTQYRVTSVVMLASAGVQQASAQDLNVDLATDGTTDVYVTLASNDRLAEVGTAVSKIVAVVTFNPDAARVSPVEEFWGGRLFSSDDVTAAGRTFAPVAGHGLNSYLAEDSFSLYFTALVTAGREDEALSLVMAGR
ncbi:alpha/beta hydrolase [Arthrobacter citreus]|uniref:alpha/beta hydrolase n=1 Tax=Arthrobacter citreus TaxID=1670 RepID=UPI0031F8025F